MFANWRASLAVVLAFGLALSAVLAEGGKKGGTLGWVVLPEAMHRRHYVEHAIVNRYPRGLHLQLPAQLHGSHAIVQLPGGPPIFTKPHNNVLSFDKATIDAVKASGTDDIYVTFVSPLKDVLQVKLFFDRTDDVIRVLVK